MTRHRAAGLTVLAVLLNAPGTPALSAKSQRETQAILVNTCLITSNVGRLAAFYESVLGARPIKTGADYVEFRSDRGVLALFSAAAQERYIPSSAQPGGNRGVVLEFQVGDVDAEYRRLHSIVKTWVKAPTRQPWGTRSIYFRDPDGNLVDFFTPPAMSAPIRTTHPPPG